MTNYRFAYVQLCCGANNSTIDDKRLEGRQNRISISSSFESLLFGVRSRNRKAAYLQRQDTLGGSRDRERDRAAGGGGGGRGTTATYRR